MLVDAFGDLGGGRIIDLVGDPSAHIIRHDAGLWRRAFDSITARLIRDVEAGKRNAFIAGLIWSDVTLLFVGGSVVLLIGAPLFFHTALADKFGFGQACFLGRSPARFGRASP